jgi:hypothetical protein
MRLQSENTKHVDQLYDTRNLCQTQVSPSWPRTCARPRSPAPSRCHTGNEQQQPEACRQMAQRPMNARRKAMETCTHTCTRSSIAIRRTTRGGYSTYFTKSKSVHTLKGLAGDLACIPRLRQRHSFLRMLLSQKSKTSRITSPTYHAFNAATQSCRGHFEHKWDVRRLRSNE